MSGADFAALAQEERWPELAAALAAWLPGQRWFGGKAREIAGVEVVDALLLDRAASDDGVLVVLTVVRYADGGEDSYQVPLVAAGARPADVSVDGAELVDATADQAACLALAAASLDGLARRTTRGATVHGDPLPDARGRSFTRARRLGVEQSNTSVVLDDAVILKLFRRLEPGLNPEVELTRVLTEAEFPEIPAQVGALQLEAGPEPTCLTVLAEFASGAEEGWALAVTEAEAVRDGQHGSKLTGPVGGLGEVVARMHLAFRDRLGARRATHADAQRWVADMHGQARRILDLAARRAPEVAAPVLDARERIGASIDAVLTVEDLGLLVRTHGDLHLGQVLADAASGWKILDFEGEPARPLSQRRDLQTPLRDVAGVLRSFDYAAASAELDPSPTLATWRDGLRAAFSEGYRTVAEPAALIPASSWAPLLAAFELDKAIYELGYELENRPTWVAIPVTGIMRVIAGVTTPP